MVVLASVSIASISQSLLILFPPAIDCLARAKNITTGPPAVD
jgi:hypothetical protein